MRTARSMLLTLAVLATAAALAAQAAAFGPMRPLPARTQAKPAAPVPVVVRTAAMLPAASYPWTQPVWVSGRGPIGVTQLPAARLVGTQPVFVLVHGLVVPELP